MGDGIQPASAETEPSLDLDEVTVYIETITSAALAPPPAGADRATDPVPPSDIDRHLAVMSEHAVIDGLPRKTRFRFFKRFVLRFARVFTHHQVAFNQATLESVQEVAIASRQHAALVGQIQDLRNEIAGLEHGADALRTEAGAFRTEVRNRLTTAHAGVASVQLGLEENLEAVERLEKELSELRLTVFDLAQGRAGDRTELMMQHSRLEMLLREARRHLPQPEGKDPLALAFRREMENGLASLYADFEKTFRGSRDEISRRQEVYLDYVYFLKGGNRPVLDLGCGRGEWLDLLRQHGIPGYGVDTNRPFVDLNLERELDVRLEDGAEHLAQVDESSLGAVSAFHLVEHIDTPALVALIDGALRALVPGGLLILETPNPTNLVVGASAFYLDPTHLKPIHPQFLEFLVAARGFVDVEQRFLNPAPEPSFVVPALAEEQPAAAMERLVEHLNWTFFGPQDFAVIGRKAGPA